MALEENVALLSYSLEAGNAMAVRRAQVAHAGVLNATFGIPGHSDIPSDAGEHKVVITVLELEAELEWLCVPREKESVFLIVSRFFSTFLPALMCFLSARSPMPASLHYFQGTLAYSWTTTLFPRHKSR